MSLLEENIGVRKKHARSFSEGLSLVMDLTQQPSCAQRSPKPMRNSDSTADTTSALNSQSFVFPRNQQSPDQYSMSNLSGADSLSQSDPESGRGTPSPNINQMSMVSPPFTPTSSTLSLPLEGPPELSLPSKHVNEVAKQLDHELPKVFCESRARIPTTNGEEIFLHVYSNDVDSKEHLAIVFGQNIHSKTLFAPREGESEHDRMTRGAYTGKLYPGRSHSGPDPAHPISYDEPVSPSSKDVLCRIHSECYTGETAWSARCDCGEQLDEAARQMSLEGRGCIVYLRQEGRGIGLGEKLKAYNLQDLGADTVQANLMLRHPADGRSFGLATAILLDLGLDHIRLMTNNPDKIVAVEGRNHEISVTQRVPMVPLSWQKKGGFQSEEVDKYLATKIERMGHLLQR